MKDKWVAVYSDFRGENIISCESWYTLEDAIEALRMVTIQFPGYTSAVHGTDGIYTIKGTRIKVIDR